MFTAVTIAALYHWMHLTKPPDELRTWQIWMVVLIFVGTLSVAICEDARVLLK